MITQVEDTDFFEKYKSLTVAFFVVVKFAGIHTAGKEQSKLWTIFYSHPPTPLPFGNHQFVLYEPVSVLFCLFICFVF